MAEAEPENAPSDSETQHINNEHSQSPTSPTPDHNHDDADTDNENPPTPPPKSPVRQAPPRRQSSFAQPRPNGEPRTANRVRFDFHDPDIVPQHQNGHVDPRWLREEDPLELELDDELLSDNFDRDRQDSLPLLTGVEAPSVALASDEEFNPEDHLETARPRSGLHNAFMNMANSIIGAGIIGQPYAFRQAGLITGIILLVALTITVDWTIRLIVINSKLSGANSFQATMERCFGKPGLIAISLAQWAFAFGGMIAFCIIIGDTIPHVIVALFPSFQNTPFLWLLTDRRAVIVILVLGVSYPLSLYRDIALLAKASTLALISMLVIIITVITQGPRVPREMRGALRGNLFIKPGIFQAIGVISFAFVCHHNSLLIYGSLKKPTIDRFAKVTHYSTGISMAACLAMALAGFLSFGDKTDGNVLNNFPEDNVVVNVARLCFGLNMLTTLPLECFVCREVVTNYFYPSYPSSSSSHNNPHPSSTTPTPPTHLHLTLTTALILFALLISLLTTDLGAVFELIGATSACALAYILPPLCWLKLARRRGWWETGRACAVVAFGVGVLGVSVVLAVGRLIGFGVGAGDDGEDGVR